MREVRMNALNSIRCRLGWHKWGPLVGDDEGGHQRCARCLRTRRIHTNQPPEAHDHLDL